MKVKRRIPKNQPLKAALVGGHGGFIMAHHETAILMSGTRQIVCGALHQDPAVALQAAKDYRFPLRGYENWQAMLADCGAYDFAVIATPNFCHYEQAKAFLSQGIPVVLEKPMTMTSGEANELDKLCGKGVPLMLAHGYWGHYTARLMKYIVQAGLIGKVVKAVAEYDQGWLATKLEDTGNQQAGWRTDPKKAGISGCGGDIGTHALMQALFVLGLEPKEVKCARLATLVPGRALDDDFSTQVVLVNGTVIDVRASQVRIGHNNHLRLEVNGTKGSVVWDQEDCEHLRVCRIGKPDLVYSRGNVSRYDGFLGNLPKELLSTYWPSGHPEGLHDAWRYLYDCFEADVRRYYRGLPAFYAGLDYASSWQGLLGLKFLEAAVASSEKGKPAVILD